MSDKLDVREGRRKTFDIKFVEVTEENIDDVVKWCGGIAGGEGKDRFVKVNDKNAMNVRQTKAYAGDYVVWSEETRNYKVFIRKSFHKAYEEVATVVRHRDADSGEYISEAQAEAAPKESVKETDIVSVELPKDAGLS